MILTVSPPIYAIGEKKPEKKKFRASTEFEPVTSENTGAMLYANTGAMEVTGSVPVTWPGRGVLHY